MGKYQSRKVAYKAKRNRLLGTVCCNCRVDAGDKIEYHHIVPLECGGKDIISNLAPVCPECHSIISFGRQRKRPQNPGRKCKVKDEALLDNVFRRYVAGEIMEIEARQELGRPGSKIRDMVQFKEWCARNNIELGKNAHFGRGGPQH